MSRQPSVHHHDLDSACVRALFPALGGETVFLDNAGGSQVPRAVADAMHRYLVESYVQRSWTRCSEPRHT